jgi:hypothetical protein
MSWLAERYAELWARRERARAAYRSGHGQRLELERAFDEFADLTSGEALGDLAREVDGARFETARESARRLLRGVQARVLEARTLPLEQEIRSRERALRLRVGSRERSAFAWLADAARLESAEARLELQRGLDGADAQLAGPRAEWRARRAEELAKLGFGSPRAWAEALRPGVDLDAWCETARRVLAATELAWHDALRAASGTVPLRGSVDLARALALPRWQRAFEGRTWEALDSLTGAWGTRLLELRGLVLEAELGEQAHPLPFLHAPRVPGELRLGLRPPWGLFELDRAFELGGRALSLGFASESLPVERRLLGDRALALGWGRVFAERIADPAWLDPGPLASRADELAAQARVLGLARVRSAAARALGELELAALPADADPRAVAGAHAARMREALGCDWSEPSLLRDCRAEPAAVDELRAACFAAQLAAALRERHGRAFWRARACGALFMELWNTGTTYTAEDLAAELGLGPLSCERLCEQGR